MSDAHSVSLNASQTPYPHGLIASDGVQAVCACGKLLTVYGTTRTLLAALAEHVTEANRQP